jgi:SH3-like domain-containing protein
VQFEDSQVRAAAAKADLVREVLGRDAMRPVWLWLVIAGALSSAASLSIAQAEPRRTVEAATVRKKPGERAPAVAQLPAGTPVTVLGLEGRWLHVRALSVEGYLTRTQVTEADVAPAPPGQTGQWSAARKVGGKLSAELFVQVAAARGVLRTAPRAEAAPVVELARGARLVVVDAASDPAWIRARDPAGRDGWIARGEVDNGAVAVVVAGVDLTGTAGARDERRTPTVTGATGAIGAVPALGRLDAFSGRVEVGIGLRTLGMALTSNAEGGLANYVLDADAVAATLDACVVRRFGKSFVAADARVSGSDASPGIDYPGPTALAGKIPFRTLATDVGVRLGTRVRVFDLALRAGGHYDAFLAGSVRNAGMLPRERLLGATLGVRVEIAPDRSPVTVSARFDTLAIGARGQTAGLEDGASSTARALWGGATMRYTAWRRIAVLVGYDFSRASTEWSGMSLRQPGVTRTRRIDTAQLVQLGISTAL